MTSAFTIACALACACSLITVVSTRTARAAVPADAPFRSRPWRVAGRGHGTPAADESSAYFLTRAHEVLAVDVATGAVRWRRSTGEAGPSTNGSVLLTLGPFVVAGDYDVVAFDRRGGHVAWTFAPPDGYGPGFYLGCSDGRTVYAGSPSGHLYAIAASGTARWAMRFMGDGPVTIFEPAVDDGLVAAGFVTFANPPSGGVLVVDAATGRERWRARFPGPASGATAEPAGSPVWTHDALIIASRDGALHAFDRSDGSLRWSAPGLHDARVGWPDAPNDFRALARAKDVVMAGSLAGIVTAYDEATGRERWRRAPSAASTAFGIAADDDAVYVPYLSGELVALDVRDGSERWHAGGSTVGFRWRPIVRGHYVYASASDAGFFAFPLE